MVDVNGTRFHLVTGAADWQPLLPADPESPLVYDRERASLGLRALLPRFPARPGVARLTPADRRGAGADRYGSWYWIDDDRRRIRIQGAADRGPGDFWSVDDLVPSCPPQASPGHFQACLPPPPEERPTLRGLAVTEDHYLVVGTLSPDGLFVFDLHRGGTPSFLPSPWPEEGAYAPFDMAPAPDGGVWVLDHAEGPQDARFWRLDRFLRPQAPGGELAVGPAARDSFAPEGGAPRQHARARMPQGTRLAGLWPVAIVALADESVLLLDSDPARPFSIVHRPRCDHSAGSVALDATLLDPDLDPPAIRGHDIAFVAADDALPGHIEGALYVADDQGDQAFAFTLEADAGSFSLRLRLDYLPMRRFSGKALEAAAGEPHYDLGERFLPLAAQPRPRHVTEGRIDGLVFDGRTPDCVWHRLVLDACIPDGASLEVESRTAAEPHLLAESAFFREPRAYHRAEGSEIPYHGPFTDEELDHDGTGSFELLFQAAAGRFLELRLTLRGNGRTTPRLRALRVHYPRFSYLRRYLPAIYGESPDSASLVERYLANVEGLLTTMEGRVALAERLLDARTAPPEFLDWLAGWLGAALDPSWDDARRRLFIANAVELYRWRGTPGGLLSLIRLATDPCVDERALEPIRGGDPLGCSAPGQVRIAEHFLRRRAPRVTTEDDGAAAPGVGAREAPWTPARGAGPLHEALGRFLRARYGGDLGRLNAAWQTTFAAFDDVRLSPVLPAHPAAADDWRAFLERGLGFTYEAVGADDAADYRQFLERRYRRVAELNTAYRLPEGAGFASFDDVPLPAESDFPESGRRLADWIAFVSLALPVRRSAHRFTVLVPTLPRDGPALRRRRLAEVEAIVAREQPAHALFDVQPFWALFTVGGARLGIDSLLGEGSRFTALVLDAGEVGRSFVTARHPFDVPDRLVIGRDALRREGP